MLIKYQTDYVRYNNVNLNKVESKLRTDSYNYEYNAGMKLKRYKSIFVGFIIL